MNKRDETRMRRTLAQLETSRQVTSLELEKLRAQRTANDKKIQRLAEAARFEDDAIFSLRAVLSAEAKPEPRTYYETIDR